jgi:hypothetical protein
MKDEIAQGVRSASSDGTQPNEAARSNALTVVQAFRAAAIEPQRVVGDPDGGIAVYIFGGTSTGNGGQSKFARVLATNEGEIIAMCVDSKTSRPGVWEADTSNLDKSISRIQSFING